MPLDLDLLYPEERQTYLELGRRYDPEVALAQADATLTAFAGSMRELIEQDFLLDDQMALRVVRDKLNDLHHGRSEEPVDPDAVPVLVGMVITLAREAEEAAKEAARVAYHASKSIVDLMIVHWFKVVAQPKKGCEPPPRKTGSLQELLDLNAEDKRRANELRDLRRAREREVWTKSESAPPPVEAPKAAPYRAPPAGRKATSKKKKSNKPSGPTPEQIVWKEAVEACKKERSEHRRSALTSSALLALGLGGLLMAAEWDSEGHTQANSKLAAMGVILALVSFFSLMKALIHLVVISRRLGSIEGREPVERRWE
jgi:hypothetical protein